MNVQSVLLITIDSLRYDRVLSMAGARDRAPTMNQIADEFVSFEQAVSNGSNTPSSFPTILTSTHPLMYGGYRYLDEHRPFLSETLRDSGFSTVGYHSNPHLGTEKNYNHGFECFNDGAESEDDSRTLKNLVDDHVDSDSLLYRLLRRAYHLASMTTDTSAYAEASEITERGTDWLADDWDQETPFFMWLHYMDVHYPFTPPDQFLEAQNISPLSKRRIATLNGKMHEDPNSLTEQDIEDLLALYDGEIRYVDHNIQKLLDHLESRGVLADTLVCITADHGEAFGEHDRFGHHPYLYDELVRVPLLIRADGLDARQVAKQVSLIDLGPTIYDAVGVETPDTVQGESFYPLLVGEDHDWDEFALGTSLSGSILACRTPRWKCLWHLKEGGFELYDLEADPGETNDVSDENPDVVDRFQERIEAHLEMIEDADVDLPDVEQSDEVKQRLADLGYIE